MPFSSDANVICVYGALELSNFLPLLAALHNITEKRHYSDFTLDFSDCNQAYAPQMLGISAVCQNYWKKGIDIHLILPKTLKTERLFKNTNWAHLIDFRSFDKSRFRGYTHVPALRFSNGIDQHLCVNKVLDVLLAAMRNFTRTDFRAIEWSINEITDNVINHAKSSVGGFIQVTNFTKRRQIEFVVCDVGLSIPSTLRDGHPKILTDQEALDRAIREGVTRDREIGQGNGLYGTWSITQRSGGRFHILSNYAELTSDSNSVSVNRLDIPFPGTLVSARVGYGERVDLSDALVISGVAHQPTDYIETHFEQDDSGNISFLLVNESEGFGSRAVGEPLRRKLVNVTACVGDGRVMIDCSDVPLVSSSFADEVFGKLFAELGPVDFSSKISLENVDPLVKGLIDKAILQRMNK